MAETLSSYKNLISSVDVSRHVDEIEIFSFVAMSKDTRFSEFESDIKSNNDSIELNLIKNNAYKEGTILQLTKSLRRDPALYEIVREQQKTFGGSKLFYLNEDLNKILVVAVPGSTDGKLKMVITRLNKANEKVHRLNAKIKRENMDAFMKKTGSTDEKDKIINMINKNLKV